MRKGKESLYSLYSYVIWVYQGIYLDAAGLGISYMNTLTLGEVGFEQMFSIEVLQHFTMENLQPFLGRISRGWVC